MTMAHISDWLTTNEVSVNLPLKFIYQGLLEVVCKISGKNGNLDKISLPGSLHNFNGALPHRRPLFSHCSKIPS